MHGPTCVFWASLTPFSRQCLHHSGYSANMIEVAGADTATLNAIGNTGAQVC